MKNPAKNRKPESIKVTEEELDRLDIPHPELSNEVREDVECSFCGAHYNAETHWGCPICFSLEFLARIHEDKQCDNPTGVHVIDHECEDGPKCKHCGEKFHMIPHSTMKKIKNDLPYSSNFNPENPMPGN